MRAPAPFQDLIDDAKALRETARTQAGFERIRSELDSLRGRVFDLPDCNAKVVALYTIGFAYPGKDEHFQTARHCFLEALRINQKIGNWPKNAIHDGLSILLLRRTNQ